MDERSAHRPRPLILGTAGHIDHGKTALVRALTGVDTDRLPEEKRRGITIDLGFAPLRLEGIGTIGVVDVPGHEGFVRTMLAGSTGIDLALLVVAADEGVMPQTREHLQILSLLGVKHGVVALTKSDLVDAEWLHLVSEDVKALLEPTELRGADVVPVSSLTGEGVDLLRAALKAAAENVAERTGEDLFRMPVDRAFSLRGTGTVVTGTVWSGELRRGSARLFPGGREVRVRDLQSHGSSVDRAVPGTRVAVALSDTTVDDVSRGAVLVSGEEWAETSLWRVRVTLLDGAAATTPRTRLRLHLGASDVGARVRLFERGSENVAARLKLDEPAVARAGDRFVLRGGSPPRVIGGGVILDPQPLDRRARPIPAPSESLEERLRFFADEAAGVGLDRQALPIRLGIPAGQADAVVAGAGLIAAGRKLYSRAVFEELLGTVYDLTSSHHANEPADAGVSLDEIRGKTSASSELVAAALHDLSEKGSIVVAGAVAHLPGWVPKLLGERARLADLIVHDYCTSAEEPPTVAEMVSKHGSEASVVIRFVEREGRIVRISPELYCATEAVESMVGRLKAGMGRGGAGAEFTPAELREMVGVSRKYLIPLLEYCDRSGVTARKGSARVLR